MENLVLQGEIKYAWPDSNGRLPVPETGALSPELQAHVFCFQWLTLKAAAIGEGPLTD